MDTVGRYSIVKARYQIGDTVGTIGVIGPTRMDYPKVVTLIEEVARHMSRPASEA
jgi:heat-inducible transcriptional repressor